MLEIKNIYQILFTHGKRKRNFERPRIRWEYKGILKDPESDGSTILTWTLKKYGIRVNRIKLNHNSNGGCKASKYTLKH
jgi:3-deoxy-D-arabino-heptulosonate 7-phosphate (DAHP) synthase